MRRDIEVQEKKLIAELERKYDPYSGFLKAHIPYFSEHDVIKRQHEMVKLIGKNEGKEVGQLGLGGFDEAITKYSRMHNGVAKEGFLDGFSDAAARATLGLLQGENIALEHVHIFHDQKQAFQKLVSDTSRRQAEIQKKHL